MSSGSDASALAAHRAALVSAFARAAVSDGVVTPGEEAIERLARFGALVLAGNARVNLTAARSPEAIAEHIVDSAVLAPLVVESLADVGSGGGFPAIPLAILTGARLLLLESVGKKARFLEEATKELGLDAVVRAERAEVVAREPAHRGTAARATARAVGGITVVLELTVPLLRVGGLALVQRGATTDDERRALADAALVLGARIVEERPGSGERRLFVVEKMLPTTGRFPRRAGMPVRKPLCLP